MCETISLKTGHRIVNDSQNSRITYRDVVSALESTWTLWPKIWHLRMNTNHDRDILDRIYGWMGGRVETVGRIIWTFKIWVGNFWEKKFDDNFFFCFLVGKIIVTILRPLNICMAPALVVSIKIRRVNYPFSSLLLRYFFQSMPVVPWDLISEQE